MPERRAARDVPERIERLSRALDRIAAGQPAPVLDDPELQRLVQLATRLQAHLPRDLPDPGFREDLKDQLAAGNVRRLRRHAPPRVAARRAAFPYPAAIAAIAAVLVAAVTVGSLAILTSTHDSGDALDAVGAGQTFAVSPTAPPVTSSGTSVPATTVAMATTQQPGPSPAESPSADPTTTAADQRTRTAQPTRTAGQPPTPTPRSATATLIAATATPGTAVSPSATTEPQLAGVPPVDAAHLECGPCPAADGGGEPPNANVSVALEAPLPDLADTAPVYTLVPPEIDPRQLVEAVAAALHIDGAIVTGIDARGKLEYSVIDPSGASFFWVPGTGTFQFSLPASSAATPAASDLTPDRIVANALAWLATIGYPTDDLTAQPRIIEDGEGNWRLELWNTALPYNSFGHPIGVVVTLSADGQVVEGSGFWLSVASEEQVAILSAAEAWQAIAAGQGYWTGGGIAAGGGEFAVDTFFLGYTLTRVPGVDRLVYQPTIIAQGDFTALAGAATRLTVYLQAAR